MFQRYLSFSFLFFTLISLQLTGCGSKGEFSVARVSGTVKTADGTPLTHGMLKFTPIPKNAKALAGKPAFGSITDGKFVLSTYGTGDGAVIGRHRVVLREARQPDDDDSDYGVTDTRHHCEISPDFREIEIKAGSNELELVAIPKEESDRDDDEEDD